MLRKCKTAVSLLARADLGGFARHFCLNLRRLRVASHRGQPFVHRRQGFDFLCFPDMRDSVELYLQGAPDAMELCMLRAWIEPGDAVVDVGANLGMYAVAAADVFRSNGQVLAIEPSPHLGERLQYTANRLGLDSVRICGVCAGEARGRTEFFVANGEGVTGEQSRRIDSSNLAGYQRITVEMDTLDNLVTTHVPGGTPCFVKIDVEGAEVLVLRGAGTLLSALDAPCWLVELNLRALHRFGFGATDLLSHFPPARFENWLIPQFPRVPGHHAPPRLLDGAELFEDAAFYNLAALPREGRWAGRTLRVREMLKHG
jgi:FkbM family methyltransferase